VRSAGPGDRSDREQPRGLSRPRLDSRQCVRIARFMGSVPGVPKERRLRRRRGEGERIGIDMCEDNAVVAGLHDETSADGGNVQAVPTAISMSAREVLGAH
jgi:hypothetical protein